MRSAQALVLAFLVSLLAACAPLLGLVPAPGPSTGASATTTPLPSLPATTPSPGPSQSRAPRQTPTAVTDLAQILDFWWVFDAQAGGPNVIHFDPDGTYRVSHGPRVGITRVTGTFRLEGDILTFENGWFECPQEMSGSYALTLRQGGQMLNFRRVEDECAARWQQTFGIWATWKRGRPPVSE
jgi:hypothetical protein